jgi:hypothetical protein
MKGMIISYNRLCNSAKKSMFVEHKSTKEKFMTKNFIFILIVLFTFSFTIIGCGDKGDETDPALDGTWVDGIEKINFDKGNYTRYLDNDPHEKGTFTTDEKKITMQITEIDYFGHGILVSREKLIEMLETAEGVALTDEQLNKLFPSSAATYFIDSNKLFIFIYDDKGEIIYDKIYTK